MEAAAAALSHWSVCEVCGAGVVGFAGSDHATSEVKFLLTENQNPHPFGFAQGKLCRKERGEDGAPASIFFNNYSDPLDKPPLTERTRN